MSKYCSFCKTNTDHYMKSKEGKTTCPVLLKVYCYRCKGTGHTPKVCTGKTPKVCQEAFPALLTTPAKPEPTNPAATPATSTWASLAAKAPNESAAKIIEASNKKLQQQVEASNQKLAAKKHAEYLERQEKRREHEEHKKRKEQQQIQKNIDNAMATYGHRWFAYVYGTELDCELAVKLRDQEDEDAFKYEESLKQQERDAHEEYERNERTMTKEQFQEWLWEEDMEYSSHSIRQETEVSRMNNPAVTTHYHKTGMIQHPDDFVSREAGAPLKPGLYRK